MLTSKNKQAFSKIVFHFTHRLEKYYEHKSNANFKVLSIQRRLIVFPHLPMLERNSNYEFENLSQLVHYLSNQSFVNILIQVLIVSR